MRYPLFATIASFHLMTGALWAQSPSVQVSATHPEMENSGAYIGEDAEHIFSFRTQPVKGDKLEGKIDIWDQGTMELVRTVPLGVPLEHNDEYRPHGWMMVNGAPMVFYSFYNDEANERVLAGASIDKSTGQAQGATVLMSVPCPKEYKSGDFWFRRNEASGMSAFLMESPGPEGYSIVKAAVKVLIMDKDAKVIGKGELTLGTKALVSIRTMDVSSTGDLYIDATEQEAGGAREGDRLLVVYDAEQGASKTFPQPDGKAQGGVVGKDHWPRWWAGPDGRMYYVQTFTHARVPGYGASGVLMTSFSADGALEKTTLKEIKKRDIQKTDTQVHPYLKDMTMIRMWQTSTGKLMFLFRRKPTATYVTGDVALVIGDMEEKVTETWFLPLEQRMVSVKGMGVEFVPLHDGDRLRLLFTEVPNNIGKTPGQDCEPWKLGNAMGGNMVPCSVEFTGQGFGPFEALPGITDKYAVLNSWHRDPATGAWLVELLGLKYSGLMKVKP